MLSGVYGVYGVYGGPAEGLVVGERLQQFDGFRISDCAERIDNLAGTVFVFGSREDRAAPVAIQVLLFTSGAHSDAAAGRSITIFQ